MNLFEHAGCDLPKPRYRVFINNKLVAGVATEQEAWNAIEKRPFGSLYEVRNPQGFCCSEFIPY